MSREKCGHGFIDCTRLLFGEHTLYSQRPIIQPHGGHIMQPIMYTFIRIVDFFCYNNSVNGWCLLFHALQVSDQIGQ